MVVLTNQETGAAYEAITGSRSWTTIWRPSRVTGSAAWQGPHGPAGLDWWLPGTDPSSGRSRHFASRPSLPLAGYAGHLPRRVVRGRGDLRRKPAVSPSSSGARESLLGDLEHWQFDTFYVRWRDRELRADAFITFELAADGTRGRTRA